LKYFVDISDRRYEIELPVPGEAVQVKVNGRVVDINHSWIHDNSISLIIDGITYTVGLNHADDACRIQVDGQDFNAVVSDERSDAINRLVGVRKSQGSAPGEIKAPMPGLVVKLVVSEGDTVSKGQGVIVVEAMKMENEIQAPIDGKVEKVMVQTGKAVDKGELLLVIKQDM